MDKKQKIILSVIGFIMVVIIGIISFNVFMPKPEITPDDIEVSEKTIQEEPNETVKIPEEKEYVHVYFIGKNKKGEEVYKAVKRVYNSDIDGSKIKFAIKELMRGPKMEEERKGVYTEIPAATEVLGISERSDGVIINLSSTYTMGAGTDSIYKRLYQLIKTVNLNSSKPVYLYIEGKKADVIGGDGIMLTQPLSNSSLDN